MHIFSKDNFFLLSLSYKNIATMAQDGNGKRISPHKRFCMATKDGVGCNIII